MLPNIEQELHVDVPIERVWQVVTDPAYVARWFGRGLRSTCAREAR